MSEPTTGKFYVEMFNHDDIQRPTRFQGPCVVYSDDCKHHPVADCSCNHTCRMENECVANAELIAEALNVHSETRLRPLELQQQLPRQREVNARLVEAIDKFFSGGFAENIPMSGPRAWEFNC